MCRKLLIRLGIWAAVIVVAALPIIDVSAVTSPAFNVGTGVTSTTATISVSITDDGGAPCDITVYWGLGGGYENTEVLGSYTVGQTAWRNLSNLNPSTTYYYHVFATNPLLTQADGSFQTTSGITAPTYTDVGASLYGTSIYDTIAITNDGGESCTADFYWGLSFGSYPNLGLHQVGVTTGYPVQGTISGVSVGTTYFYQWTVSNSAGGTQLADSFLVPYAAPTITTPTVSNLASVTATLNGSIISDGGYPAGVSIKWAYGTVSQTALNFASYTNVDANFVGAFSTGGAPTKNVAGLTGGVTYYARYQAKNTTGTTTSAVELSFTTLALATVSTSAASNVAQTSARLNANITNAGGSTCAIQWAYGTTSKGNFVGYDTYYPAVTPSGAYTSGSHPYLDIIDLNPAGGQLYYFRFQVTNTTGVTTSGQLSFTTTGGVAVPTHFVGFPTATTIKLTWAAGVGDSSYAVWVDSAAFPTTHTIADGTLVYEGVGQSYTVLALTPGQTYYYSLWGISGTTYSGAYATVMVTTQAGAVGAGGGATLTTPWRWYEAPNYQNLQNLPVVYGIVNGVADTLNMQRASMWMIVALLTTAGAGLLSYSGSGQAGRGQQSQIIGMVVGMGMLTLWWGVQIVPWYFLLMYLLWMIPIFRAKREMD